MLVGATFSSLADEAAVPQCVRVLSYNMHHGRGADERIDLERIAKVIGDSKADIVAMQEVDIETSRSSGIDQLAELERLTGMTGCFGKGRDYQGGDYGQAILSRFPINAHEVHLLPGMVPGDTDLRIALSAEIAGPSTGTELLFVATHLHHESAAHRMVQVKRLLEILDEKDTRTLILAGDFNAEPGEETMELLSTRLQDCTTTDALTYPAPKPVKKIDWVFASRSGRLRLASGRVVEETTASDHRPVVVELEVK